MMWNARLALAAPAALLALGLVCLSSPAASQQPTSEQTNALRANCRSDFMSKCSGVKPGGVEAFQCLKRNVASLSAGCQSAVNAIGGGAAPAPAQAAPAAPARPASPPPAAAAPSSPPPAASAPPAARPAPTAAAPVAPRPAAPKPVAAPKPAVVATPAAPPPPATPQLSQQEEDALMRKSCALDYRRYCRGVQIGGGRVITCLSKHGPDLSSACQAAMKVVGPR